MHAIRYTYYLLVRHKLTANRHVLMQDFNYNEISGFTQNHKLIPLRPLNLLFKGLQPSDGKFSARLTEAATETK